MKKYIFILGICFIVSSCLVMKKENKQMSEAKSSTIISENFVGSEYNGNFVWGVAMNFAWDEFGKSILHEPLELKTDSITGQNMVKAFNSFKITNTLLDKKSYYVKAGYGPKTLQQINSEVKAKFPRKSFSDLKLDMSETDIISYAYFFKEVEYEHEFDEDTINFLGQEVKAFYSTDDEICSKIQIVEYKDDDQFIIKLPLKDKNDEIYLAKGYNKKDPQQVLKTINSKQNYNLDVLSSTDYFFAPNIHLDYHRNYDELVGANLLNSGFTEYEIAQMFENIKFDMDKKGAKVENEAVILAMKSMPNIQSRAFVLDKPYWIVMKRIDSDIPYFLLGVNNTALMEECTDSN